MTPAVHAPQHHFFRGVNGISRPFPVKGIQVVVIPGAGVFIGVAQGSLVGVAARRINLVGSTVAAGGSGNGHNGVLPIAIDAFAHEGIEILVCSPHVYHYGVFVVDEGIVQNLQIQPCFVGGADQQSAGGNIIRGAGIRGAGELVAAGEGDALPLRQLPVAGALVYQSAELPVRFQGGIRYGHTCKCGGGLLPLIAQQPAAAICPTIFRSLCCNVCTYG